MKRCELEDPDWEHSTFFKLNFQADYANGWNMNIITF